MRRGIGVGHIQQKKQTQQTMADLGATITAERVSQILDQLDTLEQRLKELSTKHRKQIKHDAVVRARFRQLADSLGVDLLSSGHTNVFTKALGLGDYYYEVAVRVIECCMHERKFCGSLVPLDTVVKALNRRSQQPPTSSSVGSPSVVAAPGGSSQGTVSDVSADDVVVSLTKLKSLGPGYAVVQIGEERYVQTAAGGVHANDVVGLVQVVANMFQKRKLQQQQQQRSAALFAKGTPSAAAGAANTRRLVASSALSFTQRTHADPQANTPLTVSDSASSSSAGGVSVAGTAKGAASDPAVPHATMADLCQAMATWKPMRVEATVKALMRDGSVWIDTVSTPSTPRYWFVSLLS